MTLFFFNDLATPALYTLSLHDALPICTRFTTDGRVSSDDGLEREDQLDKGMVLKVRGSWDGRGEGRADNISYDDTRSEEHTSDLQSRPHLVCRLLLEKKKKKKKEETRK